MWSSSQLIRSSICSSPYLRLLGQCGGGGVMLAIVVDRDGVLDSPAEQVTCTSSKQAASLKRPAWHMQGCIMCVFSHGKPFWKALGDTKMGNFLEKRLHTYNGCVFRRCGENGNVSINHNKTNALFVPKRCSKTNYCPIINPKKHLN